MLPAGDDTVDDGLNDPFTAEDLVAFEGIIQATSNVETFVEKPPASGDQCRHSLQAVYRLANYGLHALQDANKRNGSTMVPPTKLVTANFHVEQIWTQIDIMTEAVMRRVRCAACNTACSL